MFFKPRIFISSLLKNRLDIRKKIEDVLANAGAEVLLYERNLTPSIDDNVYRSDIKDADFVIIILDEDYGTKTNRGISGVEEEFIIATEYNIKKHVYIKNTEVSDENEKGLIDKIKELGVSYYFYKDDKDLLERIQSSIMTIARDISLSQFSLKDLKNVNKAVFDYDYDTAISYLSIHEEMMRCSNENHFDFIDTDILCAYLDCACIYILGNKFLFNDTKLYDLFFEAVSLVNEYNKKHSIEYTYNGKTFECYCPIYKTVMVSNCTSGRYSNVDRDWYTDKLNEYLKAIEKIKVYLQARKIEIDCRFNQ